LSFVGLQSIEIQEEEEEEEEEVIFGAIGIGRDEEKPNAN